MNHVWVIMMMGLDSLSPCRPQAPARNNVHMCHPILDRMRVHLKHLASQPADHPPLPHRDQILIRYDPGLI
jgi:hypothetical protein